MTAFQFYDIIESKLPDDDAEAAKIIADLVELLDDKYNDLTNHEHRKS